MAKMSRRSFLMLTASASTAAAAESLRDKSRNLVPYVKLQDNTRPATWTLYATTCRECPAGCGMHVRTIDGRPIKAEGNPRHYVNQGRLCPRGQASMQGLYDPDRLKQPHHAGGGAHETYEWNTAIGDVAKVLANAKGRLVILSGLETGSLAEVMERFALTFGAQPPIYYEPFNYEPLREANDILFGRPVVPEYRIGDCKFLISFGADFLETWISPVQHAQGFLKLRDYQSRQHGRFVYVGPRLSMTAANADQFIQVPPHAMMDVARDMLKAIVTEHGDGKSVREIAPLLSSWPGWETIIPSGEIRKLAREFVQAKGSLALAGPVGAPGGGFATQASIAANLLNYVVGSVGTLVDFSRVHALSRTASHAQVRKTLESLTPADVLIVHGCNPAYSLTGAAQLMRTAGTIIYLGTMPDETAQLADWVLPTDHWLESWGDYAPWTGVEGIQQPLLARLHNTRAAGDIFLSLAKGAGRPIEGPPGYQGWVQRRGDKLGTGWRESQRRGGDWQEKPAPAKAELRPDPDGMRRAFRLHSAPDAPSGHHASLWIGTSVFLHDGRTANRGWMQEMPDPTSSIVWGSWVEMHPKKVLQLGLKAGDIVELEGSSLAIQAPVRVTEDVDENTVAILFGQGHTALGQTARKVGANAFDLIDSSYATPFGAVKIRKVGQNVPPINPYATQEQHRRKVLAWMDQEEFTRLKPGEGEPIIMPLPEGYKPGRDVYKAHEHPRHRWAMVIDLARCIGCGACSAACYAENNVAVVGAEQMARGRHMSWLRVVPYRDDNDPRRLGFIPMLCQHCDTGPCEPVCPVFASVHTEEGLNAQVYNRCIGTRYCSNNCPYKVRRFNWFDWRWPEPLNRQLNPEVTVRSRGVMEKCTFCVQRIREAQHRAAREGRKVRDGEIQPACAQTCPMDAFTFGDLLDENARVTKLTRLDPRRYHVLEELNTKPAVTYLKRVRQA